MRARAQYPDAEVLVHPECGCAGQLIYEMGRGDIKPEGLHIASTEGMIRAVTERPARSFIVATETGIMHRMRQMAPEKQFIAADPEAECAFMKTITLTNVRDSLALDRYHITVPADIAARRPARIDRMVALGSERGRRAHRRRGPGRGRRARHHHRRHRPSRPRRRGHHRVPERRRAGGRRLRRRGRSSVRVPHRVARAGRPHGAPGAVVGVVRGTLAATSCAPSGRCSTCSSARAGIATATRAYVDAVAGTRCRILHTRKTAPGLRALDIAAVLAGGGERHRADLSHAVMVKDNHWQALARGGRTLGGGAGGGAPAGVTALYVEVESPEQLEQACAAGATRLLVDNQTPETLRGLGRAGARARGPGSRSRRPAGSRWRTCGRMPRRARTSCRSAR